MNNAWLKSSTVALAAALALGTAHAQQTQGASGQGSDKRNSQTQSGRSSEQQKSSPNAPVLVLVPVAVASNDGFANGCWARLYEDTNYRGDMLSLVGPVDVPNAKPVGNDYEWGRKFDSVVVGPKARLTVFDNDNYMQKSATFKAGERVADLDSKMGYFENIRSIKVNCTS